MIRKLGRRPPKNAPALRLASMLTGDLPAYPAAADHFAEVSTWMLGANDRFGTCGPTSVANLVVLVKRYLAGQQVTVTDDAIFDLYRRAGNPGFDPATDTDDNGVDMQTLLEAWVAGGLTVTRADGTTEVIKPVAFAKVDPGDLAELHAGIAIFGALLFGVDLDEAQQTQTDDGAPWDYQPSPEWGGHAVMAGRMTSAPTGIDVSVITWAEIMGTTDAFTQRQLSECWAVILPEHLGSAEFLTGVDLAALAADYRAITGRTLPVPTPPPPAPDPTPPVPPAPAPTPPPTPADPADAALVTALDPWAARHHVEDNARAAAAYLTWRAAKGYMTPGYALLQAGEYVVPLRTD